MNEVFTEDPDLLGAEPQPEAVFPRLPCNFVQTLEPQGEECLLKPPGPGMVHRRLPGSSLCDLSRLPLPRRRSRGDLSVPGSQELDSRVNRVWIQNPPKEGAQVA